MSTMSFRGPVFNLFEEELRGLPEYLHFRSGNSSREEFCAVLERLRERLVRRGVPPNDVHFGKRFPASPDALIVQAFSDLAGFGLQLSVDFAATGARVADHIRSGFEHRDFGTFIYPEEGRLLLALASAECPRHAIFLGSYYGYWAAWAMPILAGYGGQAVLVDPDPAAAAVARANLRRLYPASRVEVVCATGEDYLARAEGPFDFVVIDAELPRTHPDASRRGKGIYAHLLRAALPRLAPRSLLVCHNILFRDHSGCPFFDGVIQRNLQELGPFMELTRREYDHFIELPTTEGVGVGLRLGPGA